MASLRRWLVANAPLLVLFSTLGAYLAVLLPRLIWLDKDGLWVGHEHLWSDWPLHIGMLRRFSDCPPDQWLAQHPMVGGLPLRYPFFAAMVSGLLVRAGLGVPLAMILPMYVGFGLLLFGMYRLWKLWLGGRWLPLVPIFLFFLSAGPDGFDWLVQVRVHGVEALSLPPREYGRSDPYQWYAGNFLVGMLLTQRAFLPGMTLAVWILVALEKALHESDLSDRQRKRLYLLAGVGAGFLPIVHVHSLLAVLVFGGISALRTDRKRFVEALVRAGLPALALGGALYLLFLRPPMPYPGFVSWHPGFTAQSPKDWPKMWWTLWGMSLPAALAGAVLARRGPFLWGGTLLFVLANLILFQPIPWDNSKVFLWAYFGLSGAMAGALAWIWQRGWSLRPFALILALWLTITGVANLVHLMRTDRHRSLILGTEELAIGEAIRAETKPDAVFLSAADVSNPPMVWGARAIYMGFGGWMPNFGVAPEAAQARERTIRAVLAGGEDAPAICRSAGISYVYVGPSERGTSWRANEANIARRFPLWRAWSDVRIYKVPRAAGG